MRRLGVALVVIACILGGTSCAGEPELPAEPSPQVVGQWAFGGVVSGYAGGELGGRSYLFLKTVRGGLPAAATLRVLDVEDPSAPVEAGYLGVAGATMMPAAGLALSGDILYVTHAGHEQGELLVVNISDPASPEQVALMSLEHVPTGVVRSGNHVCIALFPAGRFVFVDVTNPESPQQVGELKLSRTRPGVSYQRMVCSGSMLYVVDGGRLDVVDVSSPSSPQEVGFYVNPDWEEPEGVPAPQEETMKVTPSDALDMLAPPAALLDVAISGQYAYVAAGTSGLIVLDISDPAAPRQVAQIDAPERPTRVVVSGSLACLVGIDWVEEFTVRIRVVDVSDPLAPQLVGSCIEFGTLPANQAIVSGGDYVYAISVGSVRVIDLYGSGSGE